MEPVYLTFILMLSIFLGFELINKVPSTLHTPLMSGSNAISGITLVGALISSTTVPQHETLTAVLGDRGRVRSRRSTWSAATWSPTACSRCSRRRRK